MLLTLAATVLLLNLIAGLIMLLSMTDDPEIRRELRGRDGRTRSTFFLAFSASMGPPILAAIMVRLVIFGRRS